MTCLASQFVLGQVTVVSVDSCASLNSTLDHDVDPKCAAGILVSCRTGLKCN